jgi:hypothetical protein
MTRSRDVADTQDNIGGAVAPYVAGKNGVINGGMDIWQRGTSITTTAAYTVDRYLEVNGTNSIVYTRSTDVPTNGGFAYSVSRAGTASNMAQRIEAAQSVVLAGQTATLSFWYKSTVGSDNFNIALYYANSADNFAAVTQIGSTQTIATPSTSWVRVSYTYSIPANGANGLAVYFYRGAGATSTTLMTGVQLELGAVATPFARAGGSIGGELALCQRYYERISAPSNGQNDPVGWGIASSATTAIIFWPMKVTKRILASTIDWSGLRLVNWNTSGTINVTTASAVSASPAGTNIIPLAVTATGMSTGLPVWMDTNGTTGFLGVSAEL